MRRFKPMVCVFLAALLLLSGCAQKNAAKEELDEARTKELLPLAQAFTAYLQSEDYDSALGMMDERLTSSLESKLESTWRQLVKARGALVGTGDHIGISADGYDAVEMTLIFENGTLIQRTVFDGENKLTGLWYLPGEVEGRPSEGAVSDNAGEAAAP